MLAGTALAATCALTGLIANLAPGPALADGGAGSAGLAGSGAGGIDSPTTSGGAGGDGAPATPARGGGGGGAGTIGGAGGSGSGGAVAGGTGGTTPGASGTAGGNAGAGFAAGGGGGGAHGLVGTTAPGASVAGGAGGAGGTGPSGGGGGGAGGTGAVLTGTGDLGGIGGAVSGGAGGTGGASANVGGDGGTGGAGLFLTGTGAKSLFVGSAVQGGMGGAGGTSTNVAGAPAAGGAGIVGQNLTLTIGGTGAVTGGLSGDGVARADAVTFTGGTNVLELWPGAALTGNAVAASTADTLRLGGTANGTFDVSGIGVQYLGFGASEKTGSGTWTLTNATAALTPWLISQGTLAVASDPSLGDPAGALTFDGGALQFGAAFNLAATRSITLGSGGGTIDTNGFDTTIAQPIGGAGGLAKAGAGILTLSGANTYAGATTINAGALVASGGSGIPDQSAVTVAAGAALGLVGSETIGSLAGAGGVGGASNSALTLTVGADNGTSLFSGAIADTLGLPGHGTASVLSLTKTGTGTLTLSGTSTYTGATTVNGGTLLVNGSIASATTVNAGGVLGGTGSVGNTMIGGGTLAPGNSVGTLTVQGNLTFSTAASYLVEVAATADRTNVTGTALLAGTVQTVWASGASLQRSHTILSATGGRTGTFGALSTAGLPSGFAATLSYTPTDVLLTLDAQLGTGTGLNRNQQSVADAINRAFNAGAPLPSGLVGVFGLTGPDLATTLTQLSGEIATGAPTAAFQASRIFLNLMLDPFVAGRRRGTVGPGATSFAAEQPSLPPEVARAYAAATPAQAPAADPRWAVWGSPNGGTARVDGDPRDGSSATDTRVTGFAAGADYLVSNTTVLGLALTGGGTAWTQTGGRGSGHADYFQAGLYATTQFGAAYLSGALSYAWHDTTTARSVTAAAATLQGRFVAHVLAGRAEAGYRFDALGLGFTPYAAAQRQEFRAPTYNETATAGSGSLALAFPAATTIETRTELGLWSDHRAQLGGETELTLRARLAWAHDFQANRRLTASFRDLPGSTFTVDGAVPSADLALASAAAELRLRNGLVVDVKLDGEFGGRSETYTATGTLRWAW